MDIAALVAMADNGPNLELILSLNQHNSSFLTRQEKKFPKALSSLDQAEILCFYETQMSPTAVVL